MTTYTNYEIASDFELWGEYFDPMATMTEADFNALTVEEREAMIVEAFGTDAEQNQSEITDAINELAMEYRAEFGPVALDGEWTQTAYESLDATRKSWLSYDQFETRLQDAIA